MDAGLHEEVVRSLKPLPYRAQQLARLGPTDYGNIWPELTLISCWADGPARPYALEIAETDKGPRLAFRSTAEGASPCGRMSAVDRSMEVAIRSAGSAGPGLRRRTRWTRMSSCAHMATTRRRGACGAWGA